MVDRHFDNPVSPDRPARLRLAPACTRPINHQPSTINHHTRRAFTLLEVLVATSLAAMLLTLLAFVLRAGLDARQHLESRGSELAALRRTFETISRDMHSAVVPPDDSGLQFGLANTQAGTASSVLQFAASIGEPLLAQRAANETVLVQYGISEGPDNGRPTLWRYETPYPVPDSTSGTLNPGQDTRAIPMLPGAVAASYSFYDESQQSWTDTWDGQTGLPSAIRIDLMIQDRDGKGTPTQEGWVFSLPAARYANDEAAAAAAADSSTTSGSGAQ